MLYTRILCQIIQMQGILIGQPPDGASHVLTAANAKCPLAKKCITCISQ